MARDYPSWSLTAGTEDMLTEIRDANVERWEAVRG
jgi:hypothetical protein